MRSMWRSSGLRRRRTRGGTASVAARTAKNKRYHFATPLQRDPGQFTVAPKDRSPTPLPRVLQA
jgi:hypothetical protein